MFFYFQSLTKLIKIFFCCPALVDHFRGQSGALRGRLLDVQLGFPVYSLVDHDVLSHQQALFAGWNQAVFRKTSRR
jgi:hypothetical protein